MLDLPKLGAIITSAFFNEGLPELAYTKGMGEYLRSVLEYPTFTVTDNKSLLGESLSLCCYATSQPDLTVINEEYCIFKSGLIGVAIRRDDSEDVPEAMVELDLDSENYTLLGESGEDKKKDNGESQTIAAMLILTTKLGLRAAKRNIIFRNAIIYGHTRTISTKSLVTPYRLHMDFKLIF